MNTPYYTDKSNLNEVMPLYCNTCKAIMQHTRFELHKIDTPEGNYTGYILNECHKCHIQTLDYFFSKKVSYIIDQDLGIHIKCDEYSFHRIHPEQIAYNLPQPNDDMPNECKEIYNEARMVYASSSRSSCALLRLCIQKLLPYIGGQGKKINDDINSLRKSGIKDSIINGLDLCRVTGNNAVHPGFIDFEEEGSEIAAMLFTIINTIVEKTLTQDRIDKETEEKLNELKNRKK